MKENRGVDLISIPVWSREERCFKEQYVLSAFVNNGEGRSLDLEQLEDELDTSWFKKQIETLKELRSNMANTFTPQKEEEQYPTLHQQVQPRGLQSGRGKLEEDI